MCGNPPAILYHRMISSQPSLFFILHYQIFIQSLTINDVQTISPSVVKPSLLITDFLSSEYTINRLQNDSCRGRYTCIQANPQVSSHWLEASDSVNRSHTCHWAYLVQGSQWGTLRVYHPGTEFTNCVQQVAVLCRQKVSVLSALYF